MAIAEAYPACWSWSSCGDRLIQIHIHEKPGGNISVGIQRGFHFDHRRRPKVGPGEFLARVQRTATGLPAA